MSCQQYLLRRDALELSQVWQQLREPGRQPVRLLAAQVDDLLGDAQLEVPTRQVEKLVAILAVPAELDGAANFGLVAADDGAGLLEFVNQLLDGVRIAA